MGILLFFLSTLFVGFVGLGLYMLRRHHKDYPSFRAGESLWVFPEREDDVHGSSKRNKRMGGHDDAH